MSKMLIRASISLLASHCFRLSPVMAECMSLTESYPLRELTLAPVKFCHFVLQIFQDCVFGCQASVFCLR